MKSLRTKKFVAGVLIFFFGFTAFLFVSYIQIKDTVSELVEMEIRKYGENDSTVRGQIQNDIAAMRDQIGALTNGMHNNKDTVANSEQNVYLVNKLQELEAKINAMDSAPKYMDSIESKSSKTEIDNEFTIKVEEAIQFKADYIQQLEDDLFYESQDTDWSAIVNEKINRSIEQYQEQIQRTTSVISMDCKSTLCRLELAHSQNEDPSFFELSLLHSLGDEIGESSSQTIKDEKGEIYSTVYYLARRGHSVARN